MKKYGMILLVFVLLLSACSPIVNTGPGDDIEAPTNIVTVDPVQEITPEPRAEVDTTRPPLATMTVGGETVEAGLGTYCWTDVSDGVGLCLDAIGIATQPDALLTGSPFTAQFFIPVEEAPRDVRLSIRAATPELEMEEENALGLRWWAYGESDAVHSLSLEREPSIELNLEPGLYVFDLFVSWESLGDASYGFLVQVE
jgi:hypothetical protein